MSSPHLRFNFVDILMIFILVRGYVTGKKIGFFRAFWNFLGFFFATFLSLHYYQRLGNVILEVLSIPKPLNHVIAFCSLITVAVAVFSLIREGWLILIKKEIHPQLNQYAGAITFLLRSYLFCGLTLVALVLSGQPYVVQSAKTCLSSSLFKDTSSGIYKTYFAGFLERFFPYEPINTSVSKMMEPKNRKKRLKK